MQLQPKGDKLLIEPDKLEESKTEGGIYLPGTAVQDEKTLKGTVRAVGKGKTTPNGVFVPNECKTGDRVLFHKYDGLDVKVNGQTLLLLADDKVLGLIAEE